MCETLQRSGTVRANRKLTDTLFVLDIESPDVAGSVQPERVLGEDHPCQDPRHGRSYPAPSVLGLSS